MSEYSLVHTSSFNANNWCLELKPLYKHGLLSSLSNGEVSLLDWNSASVIQTIKTGETSINKMRVIGGDYEEGSVFATASIDAVKVFDVRTNGSSSIADIHNEKNSPFLSIDSRNGMLACGTELSGVDAEIHIYDIRNYSTPLRSLIDSHHDDVTDIKFHPSDINVLLSGSTDGYTNIYDLTQEDEDDSLHQVINYASIHSCGWLSPKRIYTLSHMETFAIHELNDKSEELTEPRALDFGDIREVWCCDYVVDVYPGFIATGKSQKNGELRIIPFVNEIINMKESIIIPNAHSEEVIRDVFVPSVDQTLLYSCGEDGNVKIWKTETSRLKVSEEYWDYSKKMNVLDQDSKAHIDIISTEPNLDHHHVEEMFKHKKHKKEGKHKNKKHSKARFKPY